MVPNEGIKMINISVGFRVNRTEEANKLVKTGSCNLSPNNKTRLGVAERAGPVQHISPESNNDWVSRSNCVRGRNTLSVYVMRFLQLCIAQCISKRFHMAPA